MTHIEKAETWKSSSSLSMFLLVQVTVAYTYSLDSECTDRVELDPFFPSIPPIYYYFSLRAHQRPAPPVSSEIHNQNFSYSNITPPRPISHLFHLPIHPRPIRTQTQPRSSLRIPGTTSGSTCLLHHSWVRWLSLRGVVLVQSRAVGLRIRFGWILLDALV